MKNTKWTYSPQKGIPGHCFQAQVWNEKGESIAVIEATRNSKDATAIAKLMSEAPETKEQYEERNEALKFTYNILQSVETKYPTRDTPECQGKMAGIRSLLKELE